MQYRQELTLIVAVLFVRFWEPQYREELVLTFTLFVVGV